MKILNCPICGKQPKIDFDHTTYGSGYGAFYTIKCKPFLRKPNLTITEGKALKDKCLESAILRWNNAVVDYKNMEEKER